MRSVFLLGLALPGTQLVAQHCGYDFASVIVVRPHVLGDTAVIGGLRITLLDSSGIPVVNHDHPTYLFHRNTDPTATRHHIRTFHAQGDRCFPFAQDNYVLIVPTGFLMDKMKVLVQDERHSGSMNKRGDRRPVHFKQQVVPLTAYDAYRLCGTYDEEIYPEVHDRPPYHPVNVTLQPL